MIEIINEYKLSPVSLMFAFLIPFSYFAVNSRYSGRHETLKTYEALLTILALFLSGLAIWKLAFLRADDKLDYKLINILHLGPGVLTLMFMSRVRQLSSEIASLRSGGASKEAVAEEIDPDPLSENPAAMSWSDLVLNESVHRELKILVGLLNNQDAASQMGVGVPKGILLQGPPGTGKTTIAKLIAQSTGLCYLPFHTSRVLSQGADIEANFRSILAKAKQAGPSLIFIDEIDLIAKSRSAGPNPMADATLRHLLQLLDYVERTPGIYLIAATNRIDLVDEALKRPGRLTKVISTALPTPSERRAMFKMYLSRLQTESDISLDSAVSRSEGASGAAIKAICNQAGMNCLCRKAAGSSSQINNDDVVDSLLSFMRDTSKNQALAELEFDSASNEEEA